MFGQNKGRGKWTCPPPPNFCTPLKGILYFAWHLTNAAPTYTMKEITFIRLTVLGQGKVSKVISRGVAYPGSE